MGGDEMIMRTGDRHYTRPFLKRMTVVQIYMCRTDLRFTEYITFEIFKKRGGGGDF